MAERQRRGDFFFKQNRAYEFRLSCVGADMCIRDMCYVVLWFVMLCCVVLCLRVCVCACVQVYVCCLLYTSDAADELLCVDLGGRRCSKNKNCHAMSRILLRKMNTHRCQYHIAAASLHATPTHDM